MDYCWRCGEEIVFRWMDGANVPIHLSGGWCSGERTETFERSPLRGSAPDRPVVRASTYWSAGHARCDLGVPITHPTACPVCGTVIFFHTNGNGDCVFFDELGPPWPKHPCFGREEGVRSASRSSEFMQLVDRVVMPRHIAPAPGSRIVEFDEEQEGELVIGAVLSLKRKKVWRSSPDSALRKPAEVLVAALQVDRFQVLRLYTRSDAQFRVGDVVHVSPRWEPLDGRDALYSDIGSIVVPPQEGRTLRIAILGWGSLLWDHDQEFDAQHDSWNYDGPTLNLEFSRVSRKRAGALTLAIDDDHGVPTVVAWCLSRRLRLEDAIADLATREHTSVGQIGQLVALDADASPQQDVDRSSDAVLSWARPKRLDGVIWTALASNFSEQTQRPFSIEAALSYLKSLPPPAKAAAAEYMRLAPEFVKTPLRSAFRTRRWA